LKEEGNMGITFKRQIGLWMLSSQQILAEMSMLGISSGGFLSGRGFTVCGLFRSSGPPNALRMGFRMQWCGAEELNSTGIPY